MTASPPPRDRISLRHWSETAARLLVIALAFFAALYAWRMLSFILLPLVIALMLTALLVPVRDGLERLRVPRALASIVTVLGTIAGVGAVLVLIAPDIATQITQVVEQLRAGVDQIPQLARDLGIKDQDFQQMLDSATKSLRSEGGTIASRVGSGVLSVAGTVTTVVGGMVLTLMVLIYVLIDGEGFWNGLLKFAPTGRRQGWADGGARAWRALKVFVRGQVLVAAIDGIGVGFGLWLVGVPLWLPLGVLTAVLSLIPTIGAILAGGLSALVALSSNGVSGMVWAIVIAVIVQQVEGNILYPILVGRSVSIHPLAMILGVGVGTALLGTVGALVAAPIMTVIGAAAGWITVGDAPEGDVPDDLKEDPPDEGAEPDAPDG